MRANNVALHIFVLIIARVSICTRIRKPDIDKELALFKDIASKLKDEREHMPTTAQVIEKMKRIDDAELKKMDERIAIETKELQAEHSSCPLVKYKRDYSGQCPDGWTLQSDGACWYVGVNHAKWLSRGEQYRGPCEAMQNFKWFTVADKKEFEHRCCAFWPSLEKHKRGTTIAAIIKALHGIVDPLDGHLVAPRG